MSESTLENASRTWALEQLRELGERVRDRNRDLTEEQIEELSVRAGRQINEAAYHRWSVESGLNIRDARGPDAGSHHQEG